MTFPATNESHARAIMKWLRLTYGSEPSIDFVRPLGEQRRYLVVIG